MTAMQLKPLDALAAEIGGVDLAALPEALRAGSAEAEAALVEIRAAFVRHPLLVFRAQRLAPDSLLAFARLLGEPEVHPIVEGSEDHPEVICVRKPAGKSASFGVGWHSDNSFAPRPSSATLLYAEVTPETGGDTLFSGMELAWQALPEALRAQLQELHAIHSASRAYHPVLVGAAKYQKGGPLRYRHSEAVEREVSHPVMRIHPDTGKPGLFVNPMFTLRIAELSPQQSKELLARLFAHGAEEQFRSRLRWQPGTLAMWDNRRLWHCARNDYRDEERIMHRVTLTGERPRGPAALSS